MEGSVTGSAAGPTALAAVRARDGPGGGRGSGAWGEGGRGRGGGWTGRGARGGPWAQSESATAGSDGRVFTGASA